MNNFAYKKLDSAVYKNPVNKFVNRIKIHNHVKKSIDCGISIITVTNRVAYMPQVFQNYNRQNIINKELIIILNNNSMDIKQWKNESRKYPNVKIYRKDESITFAECKNFALKKTSFSYITHFDDDDYYAENFLKDILIAFDKIDADIIGKRSAFVYFKNSKILGVRLPGNEHCYVKFVMDSSMVIKKSIFNKIRFPIMKSGADFAFQKECINNGIKIYSIDKYNYAFIREKRTYNHTWQIKDENLLKECEIVTETNNFIKHITR